MYSWSTVFEKRESMISYGDYITAEEYMNLRRLVGWCEFPLEEAQAGIDNAYMICCARDGEKPLA
jgi:hypothetical protein